MKVQLGRRIPDWKIAHCPWNPRPEITPESVADLTASVTARGLLQEIGVMEIPGAEHSGDAPSWWAIYGNRRLVACRAAGVTSVPVKVYECTEEEAREITRIENEQRLGVSPIEDAKLVKSLLDMGWNEGEIAAHFGVSNATVCRRAKLVNLVDKYHDIADGVSVAALERIAMFPSDVQERCFQTVRARAKAFGDSGNRAGWNEFRWVFTDEMKNIDACPWCKQWKFADADMKRACTVCASRTGVQPDLWGELSGRDGGGVGCLGNCLSPECFRETMNRWKKKVVEGMLPKKISGWKFVERWGVPNGTERPSKKNDFAYVTYNEYCEHEPFKISYAPGPEAIEAERAAAQARCEEAARLEAAERALVERIVRKTRSWAFSGVPDEDGETEGEDKLAEALAYKWRAISGATLFAAALDLVFKFNLIIEKDDDSCDFGICNFVKTIERDTVINEFDESDTKKFIAAFLKYFGNSLRHAISNVPRGENAVPVYWAACMFKDLKKSLEEDEFVKLEELYNEELEQEME